MTMKLGILEKIMSTHRNLRTNTMQGIFSEFPVLGKTFIIQGEGLNFGNRMIYTTPVKEITQVGTDEENREYVLFKTANSTYKITFLQDMEEEEATKYIADKCKIPEATTGIQ